MTPILALIGRPNVGKSTLFNQLTRSRDALVADFPGLTRDRQYGYGRMGHFPFIVVDTGGLTGEDVALDLAMAKQAWLAIREADLVLFMVDARDGLTAMDLAIAAELRSSGARILLVVNKIDGYDPHLLAAEFHALGLGLPQSIAASHGRGLAAMLERVAGELGIDATSESGESPGVDLPVLDDESILFAPEESEVESDASTSAEGSIGHDATAAPAALAGGSHWPGIRVAVVGRPNVGKSTLINRLLGEERVLATDLAGTTRDSIFVPFQRNGQDYTLIDTAGVRRRSRVHEVIEKFSIVKTLRAIDVAQVVLLVLDARSGITEQDAHLLGMVLDAGRALVLVVNKWDGLSEQEKEATQRELERRLGFLDFARIRKVSALHGSNVGHLFTDVVEAHASACAELPTSRLTRWLEMAVAQHPPPRAGAGRIKLRYAHQGGRNPPIIVIHGNQTGSLPDHYRRYLEKMFRTQAGLVGTPLRLEFRSGANPFAGRRNVLTPRQERKRKRMIRHVRKS